MRSKRTSRPRTRPTAQAEPTAATPTAPTPQPPTKRRLPGWVHVPDLTGNLRGTDVLAALKGHVRAEAKLTGLYSLNPAVTVQAE